MKQLARSFAVHVCIFALVVLFGSVANHHISKQRYRSSLVFSASVPKPRVRPLDLRHRSPVDAPVERLTISGQRNVSVITLTPLQAPPVMLANLDVPARDLAPGSTHSALVALAGFNAQDSGNTSRASFAPRLVDFDRSANPAPGRSHPAQPVTLASKPAILDIPRARMHGAGISGVVVVRVMLCADGTSQPVGLMQSLGHEADSAALEVARHIAFTPGRDSAGNPVDCVVTLTVELMAG